MPVFRTSVLLALMAVCVVAAAGVAADGEVDLYVSAGGQAGAAGTLTHPLKTLQEARDRIRSLRRAGKAQGKVVVHVAGGLYPMGESLVLTKADSGTPTSPVIYRGSETKPTRLIGGRRVVHWVVVRRREYLDRMAKAARGHVLVTSLKDQGITDYGRWLELFYNGRRMTLARYPNVGWMRITGAPHGRHGRTFTYAGERPARWLGAKDVWLQGYWYYNWSAQYEQVAAIDARKHEITIKRRPGFGIRAGQRFYAENLLAELDEPGEWYLDRKAGRLLFWPPAGRGRGEAIVSLLRAAIVRMRGASYVRFEQMTFEDTRGTAIRITGGTHVTVANCDIRNTGAAGVDIVSGSAHVIEHCHIHDTGGGGVVLGGGERRTLRAGDNMVSDCVIDHFGRLHPTYHPAVNLLGVGNRVVRCSIHDGPHAAILLHGNNHLIADNDIYRVVTQTDDAGAIYIGRDWTERGNVIRHNFLHQIDRNLLYFDDMASGVVAERNVLQGSDRAVLIGGGRDNVVRGNVIIGCNEGVWIDARGLGWAKWMAQGTMLSRLKRMPYRKPPWSEAYPKLTTILRGNPAVPQGNVVVGNVFVGVKHWRVFHMPAKERSKAAWFSGNVTKVAAGAPMNEPAAIVAKLPAAVFKRTGFARISLAGIGPRGAGGPRAEPRGERGKAGR